MPHCGIPPARSGEVLSPFQGLNCFLVHSPRAALHLPWAIIFRAFSPFDQRAFVANRIDCWRKNAYEFMPIEPWNQFTLRQAW
jgi:hypothetical protein